MAAPLLCADSLGNRNLYNKVTVTDQSGTVGPNGFEVWRAFRGARSALSFWAPGVTNTTAFMQIQCDQVRAANFLAIDRGHNLSGFPVSLLGSQDGTTFATVVTATIPTVTGGVLSGVSSTNNIGVLTEESAWVITFPAAGFTYWRLNIPAMGANLQPNVPGFYLGMSYQPVAFYRPFFEHRTILKSQQVLSPLGWMGRGVRAFNRAGVLNFRADVNDYEYLSARRTVEEFFGSGRPMWVIEDQDRATEAFLAIRPDNEMGFERPTGLYWPTAAVPVLEHEPLAVS